MRLKAILFDVDGTIAETEEAHRRAFNQAFAEAGRDWCWSVDDYRDLLKVTGGRERIAHFAEAIAEPASDQFIVDVHRRKNELYAALVAVGGAELRPGIARLIAQAREKGIPIAIATTTSLTNLQTLLECHFGEGSLQWFQAVVTGENVERKKPDPQVYRLALDALAVDPAACIAIEDSRNGLLAASACAIPVLVTPSLYTLGECLDGAAAVRVDLDDPAPPIDLEGIDRIVRSSSLATAS